MKRNLILLGVVLILCLPEFLVAGYFYSRSLPREYFSKATIEADPKIFDASLTDSRFSPGPMPLLWVIQSKEILYPVIDDLGLAQKWAVGSRKLTREEARFKMLLMMKDGLDEIKKNNILEIGVYSTDPNEAADVANCIADEFKKHTTDWHRKVILSELAQLEEELRRCRQQLDQMKDEVEKILVRDHLNDPNPETLEPSAKNLSDEYLAAKNKFLNGKKLLDNEEAQLEKEKATLFIEPVKIVKRAVSATIPDRPNVVMIMLEAAGVGLMFAMSGTLILLKGLGIRESDGVNQLPKAP